MASSSHSARSPAVGSSAVGSSAVGSSAVAFVVVAGGVMSGVGKGVLSSGVARALQTLGLTVGIMKLDPYLNFDAGLMSPYQHGEVFVLEDGREADLDLGTYERFLGRALPGSASITSGQVLRRVLDRERAGEYLGATVQYYPHVTDAYVDAVWTAVRDQGTPDVCVIEVGGTPSDAEAAVLLEAMRRLALSTPTAVVQVTYLPEPAVLGEFKTKPAQTSVEDLRRAGLAPDLVVCRSASRAPAASLTKIAGVAAPGRAAALPDLASVYDVPAALLTDPTVGADFLGSDAPAQSAIGLLVDCLQARASARGHTWARSAAALVVPVELQARSRQFQALTRAQNVCAAGGADWHERIWGALQWRPQTVATDAGFPVVALIAKYAQLRDAYLSLRTGLQDAGFRIELVDSARIEELAAGGSQDMVAAAAAVLRELTARAVDPVRAVVVAGGFGARGVEGKIAACMAAKALGVPTLAICLGLQTMAVAAARASGHAAAGLAECGACGDDAVVRPMPGFELDGADGAGGTLRCGAQPVHFLGTGGPFDQAYRGCAWTVFVESDGLPRSAVRERFRHRHAVDRAWLNRLTAVGVRVAAISDVGGALVAVAFEWGAPPAAVVDDDDAATDDDAAADDDAAIDGGGTAADGGDTAADGAAPGWFVGVQFHPEYNSGPTRPHPLFVALQQAAVAWHA